VGADFIPIHTLARPRLPEWLRHPHTHHESVVSLKRDLRAHRLHTVCESARCPNIHECFHRGTATFMILGNLCTRGCAFCAVPKSRRPPPPDPDEPSAVARMAAAMGLRYVVITSVNRDDLPDGGAGHFAATIRQLRRALPLARIEVLTPDFRGRLEDVRTVLDAAPDVFNHNMETVEPLYPRVRPQADYRQSLRVLVEAKRYRPAGLTKSGLMVGLGETPAQVEQLLRDLLQAQVDIVTIGQYLQPTRRNLPVAEYVTPAQFDSYRQTALRMGFRAAFSGPLVRSSYLAEQVSRAAIQEPRE
jgi:lipoic acid synthetase